MVTDDYHLYHYDYLHELPESFTNPHHMKVFSERVQALFRDYNFPYVKCTILGHHLDNLEDFVGPMACYSNPELYDFSTLQRL